jgi:ankyrin repeat protein
LDSEKAVFILVGRAAKMEEVDDYFWTALHWGAWERSEKGCSVLLDMGANVNAQNVDGMTPLMMAALNNQIELVELFLKYGADTKIQDNRANAAIQMATPKCAEIIQAHQRKTEAVENDEYSAIHWAALLGNESTCKKLLRMGGTHVLAQDKYGNNAIHVAAVNGHDKIVKILLKSCSDTKATNRWGKTALDCATEKCADVIRAHNAKLKN